MENQTMPALKREDIRSKSVCFFLKLSRFGGCRKVSSASVEVEADKTWIHVSKQLIECAELDAIKSIDTEIRSYLYRQCLPSPFKAGIYLLPVSLVEKVATKVRQFRTARQEAVDSFVQQYETAIGQAKDRLKDLFNAGDYPTQTEIGNLFSMDVKIFEFAAPTSLRAVNMQLYEQEVERIKKTWEAAEAQVTQVLLKEMEEMVSHLAERLSPGDDGKKKIFRDSALNKFKDWLSIIDDRNIGESRNLKKLVEKARSLTEGLSASDLRGPDAEDVRGSIVKGFEKIQSRLTDTIVDMPKRAINLDEN